MPIYIAKDYNNEVLDVVLAKNEQLAHAYWHGKDVIAHHVDIRGESDLTAHPTGVLPIVSTREMFTSDLYYNRTPGATVRVLAKN